MRLKDRDTLVKRMAEMDISVRRLATLVGRGRSSISRLNNGAQTYCDKVVAKKIERILNVEPGDLFVVPAVSIVHCACCEQSTAA